MKAVFRIDRKQTIERHYFFILKIDNEFRLFSSSREHLKDAVFCFNQDITQWNKHNNADVPLIDETVELLTGECELYKASAEPSVSQTTIQPPKAKETAKVKKQDTPPQAVEKPKKNAPSTPAPTQKENPMITPVSPIAPMTKTAPTQTVKVNATIVEKRKTPLFSVVFKANGKRVKMQAELKSDDPAFFVEELQCLVEKLEMESVSKC